MSKRDAQQVVADRRLDSQGAADYVGCSKSLIDKLRVKGGGPRYIALTNRRVLYEPADLDAWLESRKRGSTADTGRATPRRRTRRTRR